MNYKIGDKVKFLDEIGGGIIVEIVDENLVMVEGGDGFPVPFMISQLIPEGGFAENLEKEDEDTGEVDIEQKQEQLNELDHETDDHNEQSGNGLSKNEEKPGIYLALVPQDSEHGLITNLYLINISTYHVLFEVGKELPGEIKHMDKDDLAPGEKINLGFLPDWMENEILKLKYQLLFFKDGIYTHKNPAVGVLSLFQDKLDNTDSYVENSFFKEKAVLLIISQENKEAGFQGKINIPKSKEKPGDSSSATKRKSHKKPENQKPEEVDLHIHNIVDDYKDLSAREILKIQMDRFEVTLEGAIRNKQKRIIYIHGTGAGKLKYQIRKTLDDKYKKLKYQDASFMEFGYGATLVLLP